MISVIFHITGGSLALEAFANSYTTAFVKGFDSDPPIHLPPTIFSPPGLSPSSSPDPRKVESFLLGPAAITFFENFSQAVKSSNILSEIFDLSSATGLQFSQFVKKNCLQDLLKWGVPNAEVAVEFAVQPIAKSMPNLPLPVTVSAYAFSVARFLLSEKILNQANAEKLSLAYAKSFEESAKRIPSTKPDYKFWVLHEGCFDFINSEVEMTPAKGWRLEIYLEVTWMLNAVLFFPGF
ncbi:uncharacterized protein NPIL_511191 [Nephila pilipes]|uniref:Uncharacterized protein n=1 Tax=Nephila pilipes TaxID=299642 RepID=A0A8X6SZ55_NEPPI|nr:uncharacterized protein NPIL_511191 [Nephila pilipes]